MDASHRLTISGIPGTGAGLAVEGELDAYTAPQLEEALAGVDAGDRTVRLHLGRVAFIDSTGIRSIVRADQDLRDAGRQLVIVAPSASVSRLLELTALDEHLSIDRTDPTDTSLADPVDPTGTAAGEPGAGS